MKIETDLMETLDQPVLLEHVKTLMYEMKNMSMAEAKQLWKCNDKLAELNFRRFQSMDLQNGLTPAILSYEGLQYQHMAPKVFTENEYRYIDKNLRILSGFYGVLRPFDGVTPYRLEMQAKLSVGQNKNLYEFWKDKLYQEILDDDRTIINLASKEYSQIIEKYVTPDDNFITIEFGEFVDGKLRQKGTFAKMARGAMIRFMAENNITDILKIKEFHDFDLCYSEELSTGSKFVFLR